ncbi:hypothetical protein KR026_005485 [Drosophila bipectinata]|nr:hypothetical protein KR026_005485 [Drosophila bipectinata]
MSSNSNKGPQDDDDRPSTSKGIFHKEMSSPSKESEITKYQKRVTDTLSKIEVLESRIRSRLNEENKFGQLLLEKEMKREVCQKIVEASASKTRFTSKST